MSCPIEFPALAMLVVSAAAIGNSRRILLKEGWTEPALIWFAAVGKSGCGKSPPLQLAVRPLRELEAAARELYEESISSLNDERSEDIPKPRRFVCSDLIIEALGLIHDENPRGILTYRDELAGWISGFDAYRKGGDEAHWLEMFNGGSITIDRKSTHPQHIHIPNSNMNVLGGVQPGVLARLLTRERFDSGLAARMLLTWPEPVERKWSERGIPEQEYFRYAGAIRRLSNLSLLSRSRHLLKLTPGAKKHWRRIHDSLALRGMHASDELSAARFKLISYTARFALVIELTRWAWSKSHVPPTVISEESMQMSIRLVEWIEIETERIYARIEKNHDKLQDDDLIEAILSEGGRVNVRAFLRSNSRFGPREVLRKRLASLEKDGLGKMISPKPSKSGGQPSKVFELTD